MTKSLHLFRREAEVALPGRGLPRSSSRDEREECATLLRRDEVKRASHRPRLDHAALGERARDLAGARRPAPDANGELGRRCHLGLDAAESADYAGDRERAHRIQKLPLHAPRESLLPADLQHRNLTSRSSTLENARAWLASVLF